MGAGDLVTILLVDEVRLQLELEKTFLTRHVVRVLTSGQGPQVVALARERRPELVVVDAGGLDLAGLDLCRDLKDDPGTRHIPVLVVTDRYLRNEARAAGADGLISRPVAQREFLDAVRRFVPLRERKHTRHLVNLRFTCTVDDEISQAFCRDLSSTGTYLKTDRLLPSGSELDLRFRLPGENHEIGCRGVVRNVQEEVRAGGLPRGLGIEFLDIDPSDQDRLEEFIENALR